jgi:hypothetical protein
MAQVTIGALGADLLANASGVAAAVTATEAQVTALADLLILIGDRRSADLAGPMKLLTDTDKAQLAL